MSVYATAWAKKQTAGGIAAKAVLMLLADYADERGTCWPSQARIAAECEMTDRCVREQLIKLEARGLISRAKERRGNGTQDTDRFQLAMDGRNEVPADNNSDMDRRNDVPAVGRNQIPPVKVEQAERPSETAGTTFLLTTIEPLTYSDPSDRRASAPAVELPIEGWPEAVAASPSPLDPPPDPNREAWSRGAMLLRRQGSLSDAQARKLFGMILGRNKLEPRDLLPSIVSAETKGTLDPQGYLVRAARAIADRKGATSAPAADPTAWTDSHWETAISIWRTEGSWPPEAGPPPGKAGCRAPPALLIAAA